MTGESSRELAEAYTQALENQANDDEYKAAVEHLEALRVRLAKFEDTYGESDPVTKELREKVQSAEEEVAELEQQRREPEKLKRDLLEAARGFMLNDEWLQPDVIEALNHALVGTRHPTLRVDDIELMGPGEVENLDDVDRYDIIDVVRKLALDKLDESDDLEHIWRSIEDTTKEGAFRVVVEAGRADPDDIVGAVDEDIDRSAARNRLKNAVYNLDISPYHRENGTYALSTAGRYIAAEYIDESVSDETGSEGEGPGNDGQLMLGEEPTAVKGGGADE